MAKGGGYADVLKRIRENMCRSLVESPCDYNKLIERPFLNNVGWIGTKTAFQDLLRDNIISEDKNGVLTVNKEFVKKYSVPVENVF